MTIAHAYIVVLFWSSSHFEFWFVQFRRAAEGVFFASYDFAYQISPFNDFLGLFSQLFPIYSPNPHAYFGFDAVLLAASSWQAIQNRPEAVNSLISSDVNVQMMHQMRTVSVPGITGDVKLSLTSNERFGLKSSWAMYQYNASAKNVSTVAEFDCKWFEWNLQVAFHKVFFSIGFDRFFACGEHPI